tara:strand:+ start:3785 stop:4486 length:702 start_codon:yes stop_codon:yes gene_type:complete
MSKKKQTLQNRIATINQEMFQKYEVELKFRNRIYGGLPKSKDVIKGWIEAKGLDEDTVTKDLDLDEETEKVTTGFKSDELGVYIGDYAIKAAIKQYTSLMKITQKKRGTKNTVSEALFVKGIYGDELIESKVHFHELRSEADGVEEFCGHVTTMQGKRSILKNMEYIEKPTIKFQLWILESRMQAVKELKEEDILRVLVFGQECGIGSARSFEKGKYDLIKFEEVLEEVKKVA